MFPPQVMHSRMDQTTGSAYGGLTRRNNSAASFCHALGGVTANARRVIRPVRPIGISIPGRIAASTDCHGEAAQNSHDAVHLPAAGQFVRYSVHAAEKSLAL